MILLFEEEYIEYVRLGLKDCSIKSENSLPVVRNNHSLVKSGFDLINTQTLSYQLVF